MTKYCLLLFLFFSAAMNAVVEDKLYILFIIDRFPSLIKEHIVNQIVYFIDQGHTISIFAEQEENTGNVSKKVQEYNLMKYVNYKKIPENLDDVDIVFTQYGDLGKKYIFLKKLFPHIVFVTCFRGADLTKAGLYTNDQFDELFFVGRSFFTCVCLFSIQIRVTRLPFKKDCCFLFPDRLYGV